MDRTLRSVEDSACPRTRHRGVAVAFFLSLPLVGAALVLAFDPSLSPPVAAPDVDDDARRALGIAHALAAPDVGLADALDPHAQPTAASNSGFVAERGRAVSAGERRLRREPADALLVEAPERLDRALLVVPSGRATEGLRIGLTRFAKRSSVRELAGGVAVYRDAAKSTDVLVRSTETAMQVLYLLHDARAARVFTWDVAMGERIADARVLPDRTLALVDGEGATVLRLPVGRAYDADGKSLAVVPSWDARRSRVGFVVEGEPGQYPVLVDPVVEIPTWTQVGGFLDRSGHAIAYDVVHHELVMFGGAGSLGALGDTWTWDGVSWTKRSPAVSPPARYGHALVFDVARRELVLFGGSDAAGTRLRDTWVWDGATWTERLPATSPSARASFGAAYDATREELVVFGGGTGAIGGVNDTWVWDGATWTQRTPAHAPPTRSSGKMVFDETRDEIVLYGGIGSSGYLGDTWTWNGTDWAQRAPTTSPVGRDAHALVYDGAHDVVVLFAGFRNATFEDTWTWDGTTWTQRTPVHVPSARRGHALAFDTDRQQVVLFGGFGPGSYAFLPDTWTWDGADWFEASARTPPHRAHAGAVFDEARGEVVMFGGYGGQGARTDTWTWDGSLWTRRTPATSPTARYGAAMTYDRAREEVVLFGGLTAQGELAETWIWNGTTWAQRLPASSPPPRGYASLAYDAANERTVLFGGRFALSVEPYLACFGDTWTWDGTTWTEEDPAVSPSERCYAPFAFDEARDELVLFGGHDDRLEFDLGDTWTWDGAHWSERRPSTLPTPRSGSALAYDRAFGALVLFGGVDGDYLGDTWTWDGAEWAQRLSPTGPAHRAGAALVYDEAGAGLLLFGGSGDHGQFADTWTFRIDVEGDSDAGVDGGVGEIDGGVGEIDGGVGEIDGGVAETDASVAEIDGSVTEIDAGVGDSGVVPTVPAAEGCGCAVAGRAELSESLLPTTFAMLLAVAVLLRRSRSR